MRIGLYGGSFDPVHHGHLIVAECCREQAALDRVLFVPAAIPPHKQGSALADAGHRVEMLKLATGGHPGFAISTDEIDHGGVSYTVDTLTRLKHQHPDDTLLLILGPDALADLPTWREPERILALADVIAVERAGLDDVEMLVREPRLAALIGPARAAKIAAERVTCPAIGIRASDLRAAVTSGRSIRYRTPRAVERYIATHELYE